MFNDTPQARALMQYLVTAGAQAIWAEKGGFLAANKSIDTSGYPDPITQEIGQLLAQSNELRFDGSDLMPDAVNNAFWDGVLDYANAPEDLDVILESTEEVATDAYE